MVNARCPPSVRTRTVSPLVYWPERICWASGFSTCDWIARFSGRAPYTGSKPTLPSNSSAGSSRSSLRPRSARRFQALQLDARDRLDLRLVQRMEHHDVVEPVDEFWAEVRLHHAHHRRLHLRVGLGAAVAGQLLDLVRAQVGGHHDDGIAEVHGTSWPSVRRPSSSTCNRMLKTSACAFSTSSSRISEYGRRRTASVR